MALPAVSESISPEAGDAGGDDRPAPPQFAVPSAVVKLSVAPPPPPPAHVQLALHVVPAAQPVGFAAGSHRSPGSIVPFPHWAPPVPEHLHSVLHVCPAGQPVGFAAGSHCSVDSTLPSPHVVQGFRQ